MEKFNWKTALGLTPLLVLAAASLAPAYTANVSTVTVSSSTVGTELVGGLTGAGGMIVNVPSGAASGVCVARMDAACSTLTSCIGAPIAADEAVSFEAKTDGAGQYCIILKTGSTAVAVGRNLW